MGVHFHQSILDRFKGHATNLQNTSNNKVRRGRVTSNENPHSPDPTVLDSCSFNIGHCNFTHEIFAEDFGTPSPTGIVGMEQSTDKTTFNNHSIEQDPTISTQFNTGRTISSTKIVKDVNIDIMNSGKKSVNASECIGETNQLKFVDMNGICAIGNDTKEDDDVLLSKLERNRSIKRVVQFHSDPAEVVSNGAIPGKVSEDILDLDDMSKSFYRSPYSTMKTRESVSSTHSQCGHCSNDGNVEEEDDSSSEEQFSEPQPPDGGWGWVVVAAAFVTNMIADGVTFTFGIIYVDLLRYFGEGKSKTAWIGGLFMSMPLISGPIASYLTDRFGCRRVCMFGAVLSAFGFVISSFAESIELLIFTFGILSGFGLALCYVTAIVIVAYYFDKRRSLATGLSVCGSGIGTFLFAPLTTFLVTEYGWRGTTLILAGLFLNMAVCGALMRDLKWTKAKSKALRKDRKQKNRNKRKNKMYIQSLSNVGSFSHHQKLQNFLSVEELKRLLQRGESPGYLMSERQGGKGGTTRSGKEDPNRLCSSVLNLPTFVHNGEKVPIEVLELLSSNQHLYGVLMQNSPNLLTASRSFSDSSTLHENKHFIASNHITKPPPLVVIPHPSVRRQCSLNYHDNKFEKELPKNSTPEEAYLWWLKKTQHHNNHHHSRSRNSSAHIRDIKFHRHSLTYRGAMLNLKRHRLRASSCPNICRNPISATSKNKHEWLTGLYDLWDMMVDMVDLSHFTDIRFVLFAISNFLLYSWYHVPYMFLADKAGEMGFTEDESSNIISYLGIFNTVGEVILGWTGDQPNLNAGMIYAFCMVMCGMTTAIMPLLSDYTGLCILTGGFGLSIAANYSMASIILVEIITLERFTNAYGLLLLVQGLANLVGPPLAGWLYDTSGNYDLSFYLAGFFIILCGSLLIVLPVMKWTKKWRGTRTNSFFSTTLKKNVPPQQNSLLCTENSDTKMCSTEVNPV